jgi:Ca2+-transporting ATPase
VESLRDPHLLQADAVAQALRTDPQTGLSAEEAALRLAAAGRNELASSPPPSLPRLIWESATEPFILLLLAAGAGAVALGEVRDGLLVIAALVPIVGADVVTEYRAERALDELRAAAAPVARVRRESKAEDIPAAELVPGDVVLLRAGDIVPADVRLTAASGLAFDRSSLTGESVPEPAHVEPDGPGSLLLDRRSVGYSGTGVVRGTGEGIVVAIGPATEAGRIAAGLQPSDRRRSPLQRELDRLVRILLIVAVGLIAITVGTGVLRGNTAGENLLAGISAAIAAIPEEPPVLLAVILGLGAHRLLRRGVLVRRLSAEETLGAVGLILTDKTGTLTQNRLTLAAILVPDTAAGGTPSGGVDFTTAGPRQQAELVGDALRAEDEAWRAAKTGVQPGSFTRALQVAAAELGRSIYFDAADLLAAEPPSERTPYARTRARRDGRTEELALGAPEAVLGLCAVGGAERDGWLSAVATEADRGGRLLLLAGLSDGGGWRPRALLCFADPIRDGVRDALRMARDAGIQTVVVTGDHPATARAIARDAGIGAERIVLGSDLGSWDDARLDTELADLDGVARAVPEQKLRLVDAARRTGRTVAVTGDGVNDAPALQHADVAVAMGSGTAVAKGASDLVLGDDSFATLLYAVRDGRRIVANVRKGLVFLVSTHVALLGFVLIATVAGWSQPLLPIQILWLELFIDLSTSIAFEREPEEPQAMSEPPRARDEPLLPAALLARISAAGAFSAFAALALLAWHPGGFEHARWVAFTALVVGQAVRAYANRSLTLPVTALPPNRVLAAACATVIAVQALIPSIPPLADAFRATSLDGVDWLLVGAVAFAPALVAELVRRRTKRSTWVA